MSASFQLSQSQLQAIDQAFKEKKVLIIGDVMCDSYWWGKVDRISPEAPVPVVDIDQKEYRLGGAANVAVNMQRLGAEPLLCSVIGSDQEGETFKQLLKGEHISSHYLVQAESRPTTVKTRVMGERHQLLRMDSETKTLLTDKVKKELLDVVRDAIKIADAVLFVDYDKGVLEPELIKEIISLANTSGIPTAVDPKKSNFFAYHEATLFKPNLNELQSNLKLELPYPVTKEGMHEATKQLRSHINNKIAFITLSEQGVYITDYQEDYLLPAHLRTIYDVSGAGDTVMSVATLALAAQCSLPVIAEMANLAGGLVCEGVGVAPIQHDQFYQECTRAMVYQQSETLDVKGHEQDS
jgi:rfaE bifunctional protein kinase chain/domain